MYLVFFKEELNKSPLARRQLCGRGYAKGDEANGRSPSPGAGKGGSLAKPLSIGVAEKSGARGVALLGIAVQATTFIARLMDYPDFTSNASSEDLFSSSLINEISISA